MHPGPDSKPYQGRQNNHETGCLVGKKGHAKRPIKVKNDSVEELPAICQHKDQRR
jgi:hypothetical protein